MSEATVTITLTREQIVILNDVFCEALHNEAADEVERLAYQALCDDLKRQLQEQRP